MIKKVILDVLKPHIPTIVELSEKLLEIRGVEIVEVTHVEMDRDVEKIKLIITGENLNFEKIKEIIDKLGASIHSIDGIVAEKGS